MTKIIVDNIAYAKCIKQMGFRTNAATTDFSTILPTELESEIKDAAEISMGTEISDEDIENICYLCDQIISISEYRTQLFDYLKNRMAAIAPNLTSVVGEIVGAKLIAHGTYLLLPTFNPFSWIPHELGKVPSIHRPNSWSRKSTFPSIKDKARYAKVRIDLPCFSCWTSST